MIATRATVKSLEIKAAARELAQIFAAARASMPHIQWHVGEPPVDIPEEPSPPSQGDPVDPGEW